MMKAERIKPMEKVNVSSVCGVGESIIAGSFEGYLYLIDLRTKQLNGKLKPHVDGVTAIHGIT